LIWTINYAESAAKQLRKLDRQSAQRIMNYLDERIATLENPRTRGRALTGPLGELWRYRVGDHRVICDIQDDAIRVLVLQVGNRRDIYR
jgi:mRNA interferase RelE/StbE